MEEVSGRRPETVLVLVKAIAVLECLASNEKDLTLNEIATHLKMNKSTCHRILATLVSTEFVERTLVGHYRIGIGAFRIGSAMARRLDVRQRALPALQDLAAATSETIFLCLSRGPEAICVERIDGRFASSHYLHVGQALPLHVGAAPRVLLAALQDNEIAEYLARPLTRNTSHTAVEASKIWRDVQDIRASGGAISRDDVVLGIKAFGAPIFDMSGHVVAALSLSGLAAQIPDDSEDRVLSQVRDAALQASRALGFTSDGAHPAPGANTFAPPKPSGDAESQ